MRSLATLNVVASFSLTKKLTAMHSSLYVPSGHSVDKIGHRQAKEMSKL